MQRRGMRIEPQDVVGVLLEEAEVNDDCAIDLGHEIIHIPARQGIPFGHKIALVAIRTGEPVIKYGEEIGEAIHDIKPGEWVHVHNLVSRRGRKEQDR